MDWERYAESHHQDHRSMAVIEPVQHMRSEKIAEHVLGTVLDVGGGDGYQADMMDAPVTLLDISFLRCKRVRYPSLVADACALPFPDNSFDTIVLGEVLEHIPDPGPAFKEAFRVARQRVIMSIPLKGWIDPSHQWRIKLDHCIDPHQDSHDPTRGQQIVLTWDKGACWPQNYYETDPHWQGLFG